MRITPITIGMTLAAATLALAGCASGASGPPDGPSASGGSSATAAAPARIDVTISRGRISPAPSVHQVRLGSQVKLTVTSDRPDEVHLHGYDKEIDIQPNKPAAIDFTASLPGVFEVETHKSGLQLPQIEVK